MVVWYALGREWPWISGSLSEPLFCDFLGIVNKGFTIPGILFLKIYFHEIMCWLSNSNRIACV